MKKALCLLFACVLCGAMILTACGNGGQEKPAGEPETEVPSAAAPVAGVSQTDIEKGIIGKWIIAEMNNQPALTNEKCVFTFLSSNKAYLSTSLDARANQKALWLDSLEADVVIEDNRVTITRTVNEDSSMVDELTISTITEGEISGDLVVKSAEDVSETVISEESVRLVKVGSDYKEDILGIWEGRCTSEGSVFDDGEVHRWEYQSDGAYIYYTKDGDNWVPDTDPVNDYFVDGILLCTCWGNSEKDSRESWEITINGDTMKWTALREDGDKTFTATFEMQRVND